MAITIDAMKKALKNVPEDLIVNRDEMAKMLQVTKPTFDGYLSRYEDFPIHEVGKNGVSYKFKVAEVLPFLIAAEELVAKNEAERLKDVKQVTMTLMGGKGDPELENLSFKEQAAAMELRGKATLQAQTDGRLVPAHEVRELLTFINVNMSQFLRQLPDQLDIGDEMTAEQRITLEGLIEGEQVKLFETMSQISLADAEA